MRYTIVIDNMSVNMKFLAEWGYAALLETDAGNILFDTGLRGSTLAHNLEALNSSPDVAHIVLSHGHNDHCGGFAEALRLFPDAEVWGSPCLSVERYSGRTPDNARRNGGMKFEPSRLHFVEEQREILPGVMAFVVPQTERDPEWVHHAGLWEAGDDGMLQPDSFRDDLSFLVRGAEGPSLLLGCAHTGLPNIFQYVRKQFGITRLYAVIGGMHLSPVAENVLPDWMNALRCIDVSVWRPCHCTGFRAATHLASLFADVNWAGAGSRFNL